MSEGEQPNASQVAQFDIRPRAGRPRGGHVQVTWSNTREMTKSETQAGTRAVWCASIGLEKGDMKGKKDNGSGLTAFLLVHLPTEPFQPCSRSSCGVTVRMSAARRAGRSTTWRRVAAHSHCHAA